MGRPKSSIKKEQTNIRLPLVLKARMRKRADELGETYDDFIAKSIRLRIDGPEDPPVVDSAIGTVRFVQKPVQNQPVPGPNPKPTIDDLKQRFGLTSASALEYDPGGSDD